MTAVDYSNDHRLERVGRDQRVAAGAECEFHASPMPCSYCDRYLPLLLNGRLVTFDLGALSDAERRGARVAARMIVQQIQGTAAPVPTTGETP